MKIFAAAVVFGVSEYLKNIKVWFQVSLLLLVFGALYMIVMYYIPTEYAVLRIVLQILFALVGIYFIIGIAQIACGSAKRDFVHSNITTLFTPLEVVWEPLGILVLFAIMLYFGSIVILPALIVWMLFQFGLWYNLESDASIIRSMQYSIQAFKKNLLNILALDGYILALVLTGYFLVFALPICIPIAILTMSHFYLFGISRQKK